MSVFCVEDFLGYVYQSDSDGLWREVAWVGDSFIRQVGQFPTEGAAIQDLMDTQYLGGHHEVANDVETPTSNVHI
jgi:hypothetical protein